MRHALIAIGMILMTALTALGQEQSKNRRAYPPELPGAKVEVYKTVGDVKLNVYIFTPKEHKATDERAAAIFFFGGGWRGGSPTQFLNQCRYLASRGMVAMTADYRVSSRHNTPAVACVADAKSAVRWVRNNAERLGIDPERVAAGGGSAGGHLAAAVGTVPGFEEPGEDESISSVPNAMLLFNPAVVLASIEGREPLDEERIAGLKERMGTEPENLSPYHHVKKGAPPAILFHGTGDTTVPFWTAEAFAQKMTEAGNRCKLVPFKDQPHGFFNHGRNENKPFVETMRAADLFLTELGYLQGMPTIDHFE